MRKKTMMKGQSFSKMHLYMALISLLTIVFAAPQYGYQQPEQAVSGPAAGYNRLSSPNLQTTAQRRGGEKYLPPATTTAAPIVRKQFYVVSAPEDEDSQQKHKHLVLGRPQLNYRVVFIKAPSSSAGNVKYSAEFASQEEKTVIYVLSKKDNDLSANDIATPAPTVASKPEVFFIKYKTEEEAVQAQKEIQDGWQAFRDSVRLQYWEYKRALVNIHAGYGIFPYYKVSVENRFSKPHDYIITLDEGEIGLPDKYFYNRDQNDEIVHAYILLLRDFAINMGIVSGEAELFADEVFHYEKRIVNHINLVRSSAEERVLNEIKTLAEMKTIAPSLPILETLQALFPHTKITEETEVLVKDPEFFHQISTVVATSDKKPINNFIIWSLARHLVPYLSKEYRHLVDTFDNAVYGRTGSYPRWMICTKIVKQWLPFAVDFLQQTREIKELNKKTPSINKTSSNDEFLKLMYYSLRNQLQQSIDEAGWIDKDVKYFINEKLTTMRLQIGIPEEVLSNKSYIRYYYNELLLNNLFFVEHLQSIWSFRKARMEEKLKALNIIDTIISEMYTCNESPSVAYSNMLNMMVISRGVAISKYYDYRYPIAVNFARIGTDILEVLVNSISTFVEQFKADSGSLVGSNVNLAKFDEGCMKRNRQDVDDFDLLELSEHTLKSFHVTLSSVKITARALTSFISAIDSSSPIIGASFDQEHTYDSLRLTERLRLPGLRSFNENELFTLAYMQKHCSTLLADKRNYARIKPHVERQLAERYLFDAAWNHVQFLPLSTSCSVPSARCSNIL